MIYCKNLPTSIVNIGGTNEPDYIYNNNGQYFFTDENSKKFYYPTYEEGSYSREIFFTEEEIRAMLFNNVEIDWNNL